MSWSTIIMYNIRKYKWSILKKISDRQTDGRTDKQTDESDFIGRCPINVERPKNKNMVCSTLMTPVSSKWRRYILTFDSLSSWLLKILFKRKSANLNCQSCPISQEIIISFKFTFLKNIKYRSWTLNQIIVSLIKI